MRAMLATLRPGSDPTTLDWFTAAFQFVAVAGAITAAVFAARSARAAEQSHERQMQPLLLDVPPERREITANASEGRLVLPVRNVGPGVARLTRLRAYFGRSHEAGEHAEWAQMRLPPGEETPIGLVLPDEPRLRDAFYAAVEQGVPPFTMTIHYADLAGGQRQRATFLLGRLREGGPLRVLTVEHYPEPAGGRLWRRRER